MKELMEEDAEAVHSGIPTPGPSDGHYLFLSSLLGIEPHLTPRACVAFNAEPDPVRRAFFAIVIERERFNHYVAGGNGTPQEVRAFLERAFRALGLAGGYRHRPPGEGGYDDI